MNLTTRITLHAGAGAALVLLVYGAVAQSIRARDRRESTEGELRALGLALEPTARDLIEGVGDPADMAPLLALGARLYDRGGRPFLTPEAGADPRARRVVDRATPHWEADEDVVVYYLPVLRERAEAIGAIALRRQVGGPPAAPLWWAGAALLAAVAVLSLWYARTQVRRPLRDLLSGMDSVTAGDLSAALPIGPADEVGQLAFHFNEMTARLREARGELEKGVRARLDLEERLRHFDKLAAVGQLAASIAHEVGTPLGVIAGRARTLGRKAGEPAEVRKNAEIIEEQASRITRIIQQMLDFSARRSPARGPVDVNAAVRSTLAFVELQAERGGVGVAFSDAPDLPPVVGSADELQQVCLNLALNALQAMPGGGELRVATRAARARKPGTAAAPEHPCAVVEVSDTGVGIPAAVRERIFDPFFSARPGAEPGTGLGLAVSRGIVEEHDGWIEVLPRDGGGTTFRVYLPTEAT